MHTKQGGFTLIEVMVVVVILSILAAIVVPKIMDRPDEARITKAKQDIRALEAALNLYKLDNFIYPTTDQGLEALVQPPTIAPEPPKWKQGGYLDRMPQDPWGKSYLYLSPGDQGRAFDLYSLGADGQPARHAGRLDTSTSAGLFDRHHHHGLGRHRHGQLAALRPGIERHRLHGLRLRKAVDGIHLAGGQHATCHAGHLLAC